jgi:hypothetical protein
MGRDEQAVFAALRRHCGHGEHWVTDGTCIASAGTDNVIKIGTSVRRLWIPASSEARAASQKKRRMLYENEKKTIRGSCHYDQPGAVGVSMAALSRMPYV